MKSALFSTIGLFLTSLILPTFGYSLRGQDVSHSFLANNTFFFDYANMQDIVVFGDDLSAANTNYKNMKYDTKINGGRNWATKLIDIPDHKVWLWDYAHNGAVVDFNIVPRDQENTSFGTQFDKFSNSLYGTKSLRLWASRSTLFAIWFGTNDLVYMNRNQGVASNDVINNIMTSKFQKVQELYEHGARNFLFIYVPTIEKSPLNKDDSLYFGYTDATNYNTQVKNNARDFSISHPDCNVLVYDAYMEFNYIMDNKGKFGIENISDSCENSGDKCDKKTNYFWYNNLYPTYRVQEAVGQDIHEFLTSRQVNVYDAQLQSGASTFTFKSLFLWNAILFLSLFFLF